MKALILLLLPIFLIPVTVHAVVYPPNTTILSCEERALRDFEYIKDNCYSIVAKANQDASICSLISEETRRTSCLNAYYDAIAIQQNDAAQCKTNQCIITIANKTLDIFICESTYPANYYALYKEDCYIQIAETLKDDAICQKISENSKNQECYLKVAVVRQDPSACENILDRNSGSYSACIREIAYTTLDRSLCVKIQTPYMRSECYDRIAKEIPSIDFCNSLQGNWKANCLIYLASKNNDRSLCKLVVEARQECVDGLCPSKSFPVDPSGTPLFQVPEEDLQCLREIAKATQNLSICYEFNNNLDRDGCIFDVLSEQKNYGLCDQLNEYFTISCYSNYAAQKADVEICKDYLAGAFVEECIKNVAVSNSDPSICSTISDNNLKNLCYYELVLNNKITDTSLCNMMTFVYTGGDTCAVPESGGGVFFPPAGKFNYTLLSVIIIILFFGTFIYMKRKSSRSV